MPFKPDRGRRNISPRFVWKTGSVFDVLLSISARLIIYFSDLLENYWELCSNFDVLHKVHISGRLIRLHESFEASLPRPLLFPANDVRTEKKKTRCCQTVLPRFALGISEIIDAHLFRS